MEKEAWRIEKEKMVEGFHEKNKAAKKGQIVCTGSSLMEMFPVEEWSKEYAGSPVIYNRGVGGYKTTELLPILDACVFELEPKRVFINIGTNDLSDGSIPLSRVMEYYDKIITEIEMKLPETEIYLMAYYPVNYEAATEQMKPCLSIRNNEKIRLANEEVRKLAESHNQKYIDINEKLKDSEGRLKAEYTIEGLHINHSGYRAIFPDFMKYATEPPWRVKTNES